MHELPITEEILNIVLKHAQKNKVQKVMTIRLQIGKLSDLEDEWIQRYFDYLSKDTVAEGAQLEIERMPVRMQCNACFQAYEVAAIGEDNFVCPHCGEKDGSLISGREYYVKDMEVQR
jgi:hydrogenase nickel incorporation protein HypA/HybF